MLEYELPLYNKGYSLIVGCDEAGRGPLCGPVVCAACILPKDYRNEGINDSKKLTEKKREALFEEIITNAISYAIVEISPKEIDEINIYEASRIGMVRAIKKLDVIPDYILTDCMPLNNYFSLPQEALVKGDAKAQCIAAASILAKVTRDRIMDDMDKKYPQYNYKKNKGYPTKEHLEKIEEFGIIDGFYRLSYGPVKKVLQKQLILF